MNNPIRDMRDRLIKRASKGIKPSEGLRLTGFRPTANNRPRAPQSNIPRPKPKYDHSGRPATEKKQLPGNAPLHRKKPKDIWGGWL